MTGRLVRLQPMHAHAPIETVIERLANAAAGIDLLPGYVPATTWFWESAGVLEGVINLRRRLIRGYSRLRRRFCLASRSSAWFLVLSICVFESRFQAHRDHCAQIQVALVTCDQLLTNHSCPTPGA